MNATSPLAYHEALSIAIAVGKRLPVETVALYDAHGRIAAMELRAPFDLPGFVNSAMDGYAVRSVDLQAGLETRLRVVQQLLAGGAPGRQLAPGEAAAIMTGAPLPSGADTVVIREAARVDADHVILPSGLVAGANVRQADDDCAAGTTILRRGERLDATRLAVLASFGIDRIQVSRRPRVAVLVTGDELVAAGTDLGPGMRYDSNGVLLATLARAAGGEVVACERCVDDPNALRAAFERLAGDADMVLSSGGVSAGVADHLPAVIGSLGEVRFWKVRIKPGMPVLCASIGACVVFALPGNPVSTGVTFQVLARPALDAMQGRIVPHGLVGTARLTLSWRKSHARLEFLRVTLASGVEGDLLATPIGHQGSGALSRLAEAQALAILPEGMRDYEVGEIVDIQGISSPYAAT